MSEDEFDETTDEETDETMEVEIDPDYIWAVRDGNDVIIYINETDSFRMGLIAVHALMKALSKLAE